MSTERLSGSQGRRRILVLTLTGTILVCSAIGLTLTALEWHQIGWSGLSYGTAIEEVLRLCRSFARVGVIFSLSALGSPTQCQLQGLRRRSPDLAPDPVPVPTPAAGPRLSGPRR